MLLLSARAILGDILCNECVMMKVKLRIVRTVFIHFISAFRNFHGFALFLSLKVILTQRSYTS